MVRFRTGCYCNRAGRGAVAFVAFGRRVFIARAPVGLFVVGIGIRRMAARQWNRPASLSVVGAACGVRSVVWSGRGCVAGPGCGVGWGGSLGGVEMGEDSGIV